MGPHYKFCTLKVLSIIVVFTIIISIFIVFTHTYWTNEDVPEKAGNNNAQYPWKRYPFVSGEFSFPDDEGYHYVSKEWWYINGHLTDENDRTYGYMVSFFNNGLFITSITVDGHNKYYEVSELYSNFNIARGKLDLQFGENRLYQMPDKPFEYRLEIYTEDFQLFLDLKAEKPPMTTGIIPIENGYSYYYSITDLNTTGHFIVNENNMVVMGKSWLDRQWGDWDKPAGWEWFSIQLENGMEIMAYKIFDRDTKYPTTKILSIIDSNNRMKSYNWTGEMYNFRVEYSDYWKSDISGKVYSIGWDLFVPPKNIHLSILPSFNNQEINYLTDEPIPDKYIERAHFWEGRCRVYGEVNGMQVCGNAYVESTYNYDSIKGDISVSDVDIIHEYKDQYIIKIEIKNEMPIYYLEDICVKLFDDNPNSGGSTLRTYFIQGPTKRFYISDVINLESLGLKLFVVVDPDNTIAETNEKNNIKQAEIKLLLGNEQRSVCI